MPRRALLLLTALVLVLHGLVLGGLPLGGAGRGTPQPAVFHTRLVVLPPPPAAPEPKPQMAQASPAPSPAPRPVRKPRPAPAAPPAQPTDGAGDSAPADGAAADAGPTDAETDGASTAAAVAPPMEAASAPEPAGQATQTGDGAAAPEPPIHPASAASAADAAKTPGAEPPTPPVADSAGVEILPPGAAAGSASTQPPPVLLPPSTRLSFDVTGEVKRFHYRASAELLWRQEGGRYEAHQQIKAFLLGARSQTSVGSITPQGLRPERFGDKSRSEQAAHFDFERHEVIFSANTPRATIGAGAQDRLSVFIQLGAMLAAAPERYPPGTRITLITVGARSADRWSFSVEGPETLDLPAGSTPTLKLQRLPREDRQRDQKAELWLGTALHYLPVRIRLSQSNGDFADLLLSNHSAP